MTCDGNTPRLPDPKEQPVQWLHQFAEALDDIAASVQSIASFKPENERQVAAAVESGELDNSDTADYWRRFEKRLLHGKTSPERRAIQRRGKELQRGSMTAQEYLKATWEELCDYWPRTIYEAADLVREVAAGKNRIFASPVIAEAKSTIGEALACLEILRTEGLALIDRWRQTLAITEFTDAEMIEELLDEAGVLAEHLRDHDTKTNLERLANRLRTSAQMADAETKIIHIDLNQWKKSKARNLMRALLEDDFREGVLVRPTYHGAVTKLRQALKEHHLKEVANAIKRVEKETRTYRLCIPAGNIRWTPPKK